MSVRSGIIEEWMKWDVWAGLDWAEIEASFESALIEDIRIITVLSHDPTLTIAVHDIIQSHKHK